MKPLKWLALLALVALLGAAVLWCHQLPPSVGRAVQGRVPVLHNTMRPSQGPKMVRRVGKPHLLARGR
jgi:hypothetical protein